jgi:endonuclease VIII
VPEGNLVRRLAGDLRRDLGGRVVEASSPQGRFAAGAALLSGTRVVRTDAHGKHLFVGFAPPGAPARRADHWLHVHLGLYGKFTLGSGEPPEPWGALRLRLVTDDGAAADDGGEDGDGAGAGLRWADLRGPTACDVLTPHGVDLVRARLGPDPLRRDGDPAVFVQRVQASRATVAALLMHQDVLAGVGNIYRAEVLFRARLHPYTAGRDVPAPVLMAVWEDLRVLMRAGVRAGRIVTTAPADRGGQRGREGAHYVYRRAGLPCRVCGTPVATAELEGRNLFWCPRCQAPAG